jgi:hypothetical protein
MKPPVSDSERAVRVYLSYLAAPQKAIDDRVVVDLERAAAAETDPIAKLRLLTQLRTARFPNVDALRDDFYVHARRWAETNDISFEAFRDLGVPDEDLVKAGLLDAEKRDLPRLAGMSTQRARFVTVEEVKGHILSRRDQFTHVDIATDIGGSPMTIRKAVQELIATGKIELLGRQPSHQGPGRAPLVYRRTRSARRAASQSESSASS